MVGDALRLMHTDLPLIPLYRRTLTWVMRANVSVVQCRMTCLNCAGCASTELPFPAYPHVHHSLFLPDDHSLRPGARKLVGVHLRELGLRRPLIVTDRGLATLPVLPEFMQHLNTGLDSGVYSGVHGNPTASQVAQGVAAYKAHRADCVIGFGGGAALDIAKVIAAMAVHDGDVIEYAWDHPKVKPLVNPLPPFFALPTTSGTGSEVGRSSVVSEDDTHVKRVIFSPKLLAREVFADPELTFGLPPAVTAATAWMR